MVPSDSRADAQVVDPDRLRESFLPFLKAMYQLLQAPRAAAVLDIGCGTGVPTLAFAALTSGTVVGLDMDVRRLAVLSKRIEDRGLEGRVSVVEGHIESMPFEPEGFDIVWGEGAIRAIGFAQALEALAPFIRAGGYLVLHDDAGRYQRKLRTVEVSAFDLHAFLLIPPAVWWRLYYAPLEKALETATSAVPPYDLGQLRAEVGRLKKSPDLAKSVYFAMRKP
jgi:SAM-dependent methyltransferase